jgi:asparagine synthase (glutamine-hydrolysing)
MVPPQIVERPKQPYRAPIGRCFLGDSKPAYVEELLSESAIRQTGCFDATNVSRFLEKCRRLEGRLQSERESMALVGILSIQLLSHFFIRPPALEPRSLPEGVGADNKSPSLQITLMS